MCVCVCVDPLPVSHSHLRSVPSPGGPVPQVGVTISMDDNSLNGTNRVMLDGVLDQKECDTVLRLATVSLHIICSENKTPSDSLLMSPVPLVFPIGWEIIAETAI